MAIGGMLMKRIGILTFWGVPNYGAWAQSYALNKVVKDIVGDEVAVEHIDYLSQIHHDSYYKKNIRLKNAFKYTWDSVPHTKKLSKEDISCEKFDLLITGSDAIWEFSVPEMGYDERLIGNGLNCSKLVSYAASFGVTTLEDNLPDFIKNGLEKYDEISVRDDNSRQIVSRLRNYEINPEIVVDPVLLWDFKHDTNIKDSIYPDYIAVYGTKWNPEYIDYAKMFAKEKKCILISIGDTNEWCDVNLRMVELRGFEWIGMIRNAKYVFTSTYHGLLFGLSLGKQVKFDMVPYVRNRASTVLNKLEIDDYYGDVKSVQDVFENSWNYEVIDTKLVELRNKSIEWLTNAIKG